MNLAINTNYIIHRLNSGLQTANKFWGLTGEFVEVTIKGK
jgi:hypothetical protein